MKVALAAALLLVAASAADARITKIKIIAKESPTFGGYAWPGVGQYEKIVGKAFGELDPERSEERRHRRHQARAAERARQGRVRVRLLHPEADRPGQGQSQGDVRAAEPRPQDARRR